MAWPSDRRHMNDARYTPLSDRAVLRVAGEEASDFLQGLITNDMADVSETRAIYAALLTPQGKYLHDFFILKIADSYYLDCERHRREDLIKRLTRYRLRAKVIIEDADDSFDCFALFGKDATQIAGLPRDAGSLRPLGKGVAFVDPRRIALGVRALLPPEDGVSPIERCGFSASAESEYHVMRVSLGVAAGDPEIEPEKSFPMDYGLDELNGVSFTKGCYVGQEVTVRMKTRDLVRKRLVPVRLEGPALPVGTILQLDNSVAGELRSVVDTNGLALVRIEALDKALAAGLTFNADNTQLFPTTPPADEL
ncbi:MAG: folate-binding protein YgfZ [Rhodospirillaceae bacterium]|jgi:tRNA-modifying protein YgfZ|nr:folate-binding protein YgfZ [Rhodospirillaceae bacterium]MBT5456791.1 folate-binding protein YgfZ [Rhodospirillaceae bacterium]